MPLLALPPIPYDAHKYSRGSLLVIAGSERFFGAGVLAAQAATRSGSGYVTLATPGKEAAAAARAHLLSIPIYEAKDHDGAFVSHALDGIIGSVNHCDAIVLGCGVTVSSSTQKFVVKVIEHAQQQNLPLLLDADALNGLSQLEDGLPSLKNAVLTPHAGELERLLQASNTANAQELAVKTSSVVVAKGPQTTINDAQNSFVLTNTTPALSTAGTGDVLAGIIGSLLSQGMPPFEAAQAGVQLHSLAGQLAADRLGVRSVIAEDVIALLPQAIQQLSAI